MKKALSLILLTIFLPVFYVFIWVLIPENSHCNALAGYDYNEMNTFVPFLAFLLLVFLFYLIALITFFVLRVNWINFKEKLSYGLTYIFLIHSIVCLPFIYLAFPFGSDNNLLIQSLCSKTKGGLMKVESKNLTIKEYEFIKNKVEIFPTLPNTSDSINIQYYHDGFLPDYNLTINFKTRTINLKDFKNERWRVIDSINGKLSIEYNASVM